MTNISSGDLILDTHARLSVEFVRQTGLEVRLLAGAPSLLELGLISYGLSVNNVVANAYFAGDDGRVLNSRSFAPDVESLVGIMHQKFGKALLLTSGSASQMAFFNHSNDYFMFFARGGDLERIFRLNDQQMMEYFRDTMEDSLDADYLRSVWNHYVHSLLLPKLPLS